MNPGLKSIIKQPHQRNLVVWPFAKAQADGASPTGWLFLKSGGGAEAKLSAQAKPSATTLSATGGHFDAVITANPDVDSYIAIPVSVPDAIDGNRYFSVSFDYSYTGTLAAGDIQITAHDGSGEIIATDHLLGANTATGLFLEAGTNLSFQTLSGRFLGAGNVAANWQLRLKIKGAAVALSSLKITNIMVSPESAQDSTFHTDIPKVAQLWALIFGG